MRPLHEIAAEIAEQWRPVYYAAVPYLSAMQELSSIDDSFGFDSARSIVLYFLSNARTWRGAEARRLKSELQVHLRSSKR